MEERSGTGMRLSHLTGAVLAVIVTLAISAAPAYAAGWQEGNDFFHTISCTVGGSTGTGTENWTGYWGTTTTEPKVGDVYWAHSVAANVSGCSNMLVTPEIVLPPNTISAVDSTNKIRCYLTKFSVNPYQTTEVTGTGTNYSCPTALAAGSLGMGGYSMGQANLPSGWLWEVWIPVRSTAQLSGAGADKFTLGVHAVPSAAFLTNGTNGVVTGTAPVKVFANPPSISYPVPSATSITDTSARTEGHLFSHYAAGTVYVDFGPTTAYGTTRSYTIQNTADSWTVPENWTNLTPGTTYHWRLRFVTASLTTYVGADQAFTTTGTRPSTTYTLTTSVSGIGTVTLDPPGGTYTANTVVSALATTASGYTFSGWTLDGAAAGSANPLSVTMNAHHSLNASFTPVVPSSTTDLSVSVSASPNPVVVGNPITYTVVVTNNSSTAATGSLLTTNLPFSYTLVSSSPAGCDVGCKLGSNGGTIQPGEIVIATFTVTPKEPFAAKSEVAVACSDSTPDSDLTNNSASIAVRAVSMVGLTLSTPANSTGASTSSKGASDVTLARLVFTPDVNGEPLQVDTVTLQAAGTGQDAADVTTVKVYLDANGDGVVDSGDTLVGSGAFSADNGSVQLKMNSFFLHPAQPAQVIIAYDFNTVLASAWPVMPLSLFLVGALLVPGFRKSGWRGLAALLLVGLVSCGGGGGGGPAPNPNSDANAGGDGTGRSYAVGGSASGLNNTVVLQNNGGDDLSLSADGTYAFAAKVADGAAYSVTVKTQPTGQACSVANGSGTVSGADVTNANVTCITLTGGNSGGGGGGAPVATSTFQVAITALTAQTMLSSESIAIGGLPLAGGTVTVAK